MLAAPILRYVQLGIVIPLACCESYSAHRAYLSGFESIPGPNDSGTEFSAENFGPTRTGGERFRPSVPAGSGRFRVGEPANRRTLPNPSEPFRTRHYLTIGVAGFIGENFGIVRTSKQARLTPVPTMPVERSSLRSNAVRRFPIVDTRQTACAILTTVFDFVVKLTFIGNSLKIV